VIEHSLRSVAPPDPGLANPALLLRYHGLPVAPGPIRHGLGRSRPIEAADLVQFGRSAGRNAGALASGPDQLGTVAWPSFAAIARGSSLILVWADDSGVPVVAPAEERPSLTPLPALEAPRVGAILRFDIARSAPSAGRSCCLTRDDR